ncbi:hypothetical protein J4H86_14985 [Spiractinospora alimapuensis]|uniref:hypothetical protein n=1 Tax=Spiractinospora alimapuensis TaxID=2820884 RepID=UPI001F3AFEE7|nr:hypothetical protein [Spiractinospora alimapuensis]QVQ50255.1 hypothetical protein J4H86_14985 [Spiractinospora alimapuensis]
MPTLEHEYVLHLCRNRPEMVVELLRECFGADFPADAPVKLDCGDFGEPEVHERRSDTALLVQVDDAGTSHGLIVESQRAFVEQKYRRWGVYSSTMADRYDCKVDVVVFCPDQNIADRYDVPYHLGNRYVMHVYVIGPDRVPVIDEPARAAQSPELGGLSAVAHGQRGGVIDALLTGLADIDPDRAQSYTEILLALLRPADRTYVEDAVAVGTFEYQSEFTQRLEAKGEARGEARGEAKGKAKGKAEGRAESVLSVLDAREVAVDDATRDRVLAVTDDDQLDALVRRAITVTSADQLFE